MRGMTTAKVRAARGRIGMPDYRLLPLAADGRSAGKPLAFFASSDDAALMYALSQGCPGGCELWESARFVALVAAQPEREDGGADLNPPDDQAG